MYLEHIQRAYSVRKLDPQKFSNMLLRDNEHLYKTYIFDALPFLPTDATERQRITRDNKRNYLEALQYYERIVVEEGYVSQKRATCPDCGHDFVVPVQKQVDVKLSVRLVSLAFEKVVDKIVLLTGDGDIMPAVSDIEKTGTIVRLAYADVSGVRVNKGLLKCCPEKHRLTRDDLLKAEYTE